MAEDKSPDGPVIAGMAGAELDLLGTSACPLLGLTSDRRTHFTFPNSGHRCFATGHPASTDARRQSAYCLSPRFDACDRFRVYQRRSAAGDPSRSPTTADAPFAHRGSALSAAPSQVTADFSSRRILRRGAVAVLFVGIVGILIYVIVATLGRAPERGVLVVASPTGSPQATATAIPNATQTATPAPSNHAASTPLPSPAPTPRPTVRPTPRPTVRPTPRPTVRPTPRPSPVVVTPPPALDSPAPSSTPAP